MKQKTPLIRYYYLIRLIKDKHYPSRRELTKWLEDKDIFLTERTFYRYVKDVKNLYNIPISYCHTHKGYFIDDENRSEERRVGKECRSRWRQYHEKIKKHR